MITIFFFCVSWRGYCYYIDIGQIEGGNFRLSWDYENYVLIDGIQFL